MRLVFTTRWEWHHRDVHREPLLLKCPHTAPVSFHDVRRWRHEHRQLWPLLRFENHYPEVGIVCRAVTTPVQLPDDSVRTPWVPNGSTSAVSESSPEVRKPGRHRLITVLYVPPAVGKTALCLKSACMDFILFPERAVVIPLRRINQWSLSWIRAVLSLRHELKI
jgi:hypothetical protein